MSNTPSTPLEHDNNDDDDDSDNVTTWSRFEARASATLSRSSMSSSSSIDSNQLKLPDAVRAIVEQCKAEQHQQMGGAAGAGGNPETVAGDDGREFPYPCRMYESVPGEEELLQLQWMRIDVAGRYDYTTALQDVYRRDKSRRTTAAPEQMSTMDSERCWGEVPGCKEDYDCGPHSGILLPAVYRVDPGQLFPMTFVGLPPELLRVRQAEDGSPHDVQQEMPEDYLCKLGRDLTEALSSVADGLRDGEGLRDDLVHAVVSLTRRDWDTCIERHVDLRRCDPYAFLGLVSTSVPPTLDCLLGRVLPSFVAGISSNDSTAASNSGTRQRKGKGTRSQAAGSRYIGPGFDDDESQVGAIWALCELAGEIAKAEKQDPVRFRDKIAASGLRKLGAIGVEAEVVLAEAFFKRGPRRP